MGAAKIRKSKVPVVPDEHTPEEYVQADGKRVRCFQSEDILPRFAKESIELHGATVVPLTEEYGFIRYSDDNFGTAYFVDEDNYQPIVAFHVHITPEMREEKCTAPNCECQKEKWDELLTGCRHDEHEDFDEDSLVPTKLYASLCKNPKCTEQHIWLLAACADGHTHHHSLVQIQ